MDLALHSLHDQLASVIAAAAGIEGMNAPGLDALRRKFDEHAFHLVVVGEFKRGKAR